MQSQKIGCISDDLADLSRQRDNEIRRKHQALFHLRTTGRIHIGNLKHSVNVQGKLNYTSRTRTKW